MKFEEAINKYLVEGDLDIDEFRDIEDEVEKWMIYYCWVVYDPEFATVERLHDAAAVEFDLDIDDDEVSSAVWDLAGEVTYKKPKSSVLKKVTKYIEKAGYDFT
jgi:hypothetical protein